MRTTTSSSVVYFVADTNGRLKIGTSKNFRQRFAGLVHGFGRLDVVQTFPGGRTLERKLHKALAAYRIEGEWFHRCDEVMAIAEQHRPTAPDADTRWSEEEARITREMQADLAAIEEMLKERGRTRQAVHDYLNTEYGIPGWALWSLKYKPGAVPQAALYVLLRKARRIETEKYAVNLAIECAEFPELAQSADRLLAKAAESEAARLAS